MAADRLFYDPTRDDYVTASVTVATVQRGVRDRQQVDVVRRIVGHRERATERVYLGTYTSTTGGSPPSTFNGNFALDMIAFNPTSGDRTIIAGIVTAIYGIPT